jgi:ATP-dependent DNA helicase RecQ
MRDRALKYLRVVLDRTDADFRPGQWECIEGVLLNKRQLVVQKTGWGKSMVYFLGARLLRDQGGGMTLLVSPLLSLMRNQIDAALRIGVNAASINSSNSDEWQSVEQNLDRGEVDVLLISPERLANDDFRHRVLQHVAGRIGLFVVDEAHCISDWGHDFRPDYGRIVRLLQALPRNLPILATTATANNRVVRDVASQLGDMTVVRGPLMRESLALQNIRLPDPATRLAWLAQHLKDLPGSGIIYTLTVRDAERVADWLKRNDYPVEAYHSQVDSDENQDPDKADGRRREKLEQSLLANRVKALVATVALGMGFDKPDLGFVIHYQRPGSVVHYYQQIGRAGRSVDHAFCILLGGEEDREITDYFIKTAFPPQAHVEKVLMALRGADDGLSVTMLQKEVNLSFGELQKTLKLLAVETPSPVAKMGAKWHATPVNYRMDQEKITRLCELRQAEQRQMMDYMRTGECLMKTLGRALDDQSAAECGRCSNCTGGELISSAVDADLVNRAGIFLKRSYQVLKPRKRWPAKDMFENYPFNGSVIEASLMAEEGRALSLWGDAGWGRMVRECKYSRMNFVNELVEGCIQMIEHWNPDPRPQWVTCIPSLTHRELVPGFAGRLAERMGLPFSPCLKKALQNQPQKSMRNSFQQAKNLDGAFAVEQGGIHSGPVLLVDDMVDSRWTFTVAAALLRRAGCGAVFPVALALNSLHAD